MTQMKVLLCVDDDSRYEGLLRALDTTLGLGSEDSVLVAHAVATLRWLPLRGDEPGWAGTERDILRRVDDFLERTVDSVAQLDIRAEALRLEGAVASELLRAAEEHDVDVIVAGAIGQARGQDFLVGSVAEKLLAVSERSLLLCRGEDLERDAELRVLVAVDDTEASYRAVESFASTCRLKRAAIEIVHVMVGPPSEGELVAPEGTGEISSTVRQQAQDTVHRARETLASHGLSSSVSIRTGDRAREVLEAARRFESNLIVLGSARQSGSHLAGWGGTVAKRVAHHATCSVFVAGLTRS